MAALRRGAGQQRASSGRRASAAAPKQPGVLMHMRAVRATKAVPNLRSRRRYAAIRNAFVKFAAPDTLGFRLIHFAVLSNHVHFVVEADSKHALSRGMQKLLHSIS